MLKVRIIPILTFNGFGLVKTKKFSNPRMVGNAIQTARVYNNRMVDELIFVDIFASLEGRKINLKFLADVIKECFMPVAIGGGVETIEDINDLLKTGADKVVIKSMALKSPEFVKEAVHFFGSQCICIAIDAYRTHEGYFVHNKLNMVKSLEDFIFDMLDCNVGEFIVTSVDNDGMMCGFDIELIRSVEKISNIPIVAVGGGGNLDHYVELFSNTNVKAVGSASIFHFTHQTPLDIKNQLASVNFPVRV